MFIWEINRLLTWRDKVYHIGLFMRQRSFRWALRAGILTAAARLPHYLGGGGISGPLAIAIPLVVGSGMFFGGLLLQYIPALLSSRLINTAQANDLNLMETYKRSQAKQHLDALWGRVFRYEAELRFTPAEREAEEQQIESHVASIERVVQSLSEADRAFLGVRPGDEEREASRALLEALLSVHPVTDEMEKTRPAFLISAMCAIYAPLSRAAQRRRVGFDLGLLLDWYDGAYFDFTDVKLIEQYNGATVLVSAKADLPGAKRRDLLKTARRFWQRLWFSLIIRGLAINLGGSIMALNRTYGTTRFGAQALLWPGEEDEPWLEDLCPVDEDAGAPSARDALLRERRSMIRRAFGEHVDDAMRMLDRLFGCTLLCATELRLRYDPDYCEGRLAESARDDLASLELARRGRATQRRYVEVASRALEMFTAFLQECRPDLFAFENAEALRAVRVAFHLNKRRLKTRFLKHIRKGVSHLVIADRLRADIETVIRDRAACSEKLMAVRFHHTLALLERQGYENLLRRLAYDTDTTPREAGAA